ncbi:hypothetical protein DPMN_077792 [Dreissena polymorpha]|uniref:Uncharacterized protein n=1 Tax=Dreissena polymorpha TaxID=45954 RepID=A0A9D4BPY4_DREPO|nr:hypothetical protein DPMN_077792 [Dreissena polymorpha]
MPLCARLFPRSRSGDVEVEAVKKWMNYVNEWTHLPMDDYTEQHTPYLTRAGFLFRRSSFPQRPNRSGE